MLHFLWGVGGYANGKCSMAVWGFGHTVIAVWHLVIWSAGWPETHTAMLQFCGGGGSRPEGYPARDRAGQPTLFAPDSSLGV
jgi:hypothetical protein